MPLTYSSPRGHPSLQKSTRSVRAALWHQGAHPRRIGADERLWRRSGACFPKAADSTADSTAPPLPAQATSGEFDSFLRDKMAKDGSLISEMELEVIPTPFIQARTPARQPPPAIWGPPLRLDARPPAVLGEGGRKADG